VSHFLFHDAAGGGERLRETGFLVGDVVGDPVQVLHRHGREPDKFHAWVAAYGVIGRDMCKTPSYHVISLCVCPT